MSLEMFAWRTKAAVAVTAGPNVTAYFSQMRLIGVQYTREIYTGVDHTYYAILEDDELRDKQRRHILEVATQPGITIDLLDETDFRARIDTISPYLFPDWAYNGPVVVGDPELNFTGEEIAITFNVDMHGTPSLDGWSFSVDGGEPQAFAAIERAMGNARQYVLTIAAGIPEWNEAVTISYDCFEGNITSLAGVRLGLLDEFAVDNLREEPPTIESATVNEAGTIISVQCSGDMADPTGKHGQFSFTQDGGARAFSAAALNGVDSSIIELTVTGSPIPDGADIELEVTAGPMFILADGGWGYLRDADDIAVTNASLVPILIGAETSVDGESIILEFSKDMGDPAGKHAEFAYKIEGGAGQAFSVAALDIDTTKIVLTCNGDLPVFGEEVTVSYIVGTVVADDGGVLGSFTDAVVDNEMVQPPLFTVGQVDATTMIIVFDMDMADPTGSHALFTYSINAGAGQAFSAAAIAGIGDSFALTLDGAIPTHGDTVTVSYDGATRAIVSTGGGILASFTDEEVTNTVPL